MNSDPGSLDRLHDIVLPAPVPWWPPAPGWLWLLGLGAVVALVLLVRLLIRWQRNRYRREALAELAQLEKAAGDDRPAAMLLLQMSELLKRVALTAWPRTQVATLTGEAWFEFLDQSGGTRFADGLGAALEAANYESRTADLDAERFRELGGEIRNWIRRHRVSVAPGLARGAQSDVDASAPGSGEKATWVR